MKAPSYYSDRAAECRRFALWLGITSALCAVLFCIFAGPGYWPLFLAAFCFTSGAGALNELREAAWFRRMGELEAAYQPMEQ